ncbi:MULTISPECIES: SpoIIIAH-like family protein [unclassified Paenibacillus]|uniref:SpoIIIAH-like family protein n=1 Tax=unclassified Paenibacillus TaxID=185978 RepID=UPI001AE81448|nr:MULTISPECIES: SpoIIIAH-like family protein [unclassified Paenibacillus]MBP1155132.1 stage III sporulation protein AH [Paenibacillus sp. PvP091]MBP1169484.1 stage III sporulation protein AH [Paenibacillus sp. PvR098]MBP2440512.1 stage III sporulation protein AH [Paenibacillus sp. PvP052]
MNSKRQTIWLVSMLSLMVVLSAYYLFTEDVNELELNTASGTQTKEIIINAGQLDGVPQGTVDVQATPMGSSQQPAAEDDAKSDPKASSTNTDTPSAVEQEDGSDPTTAQPVTKNEANASGEDAKVLEQIQAQATSGSDYFVNLQMKRDESISKQVEALMTILADTKQTQEAAVNAQTELQKLQDMETKITYLEESLMKEYPQAVITQEGMKWKITVQANKLERSQAVSIADQVMKELSITPDHIAVQYKP